MKDNWINYLYRKYSRGIVAFSGNHRMLNVVKWFYCVETVRIHERCVLFFIYFKQKILVLFSIRETKQVHAKNCRTRAHVFQSEISKSNVCYFSRTDIEIVSAITKLYLKENITNTGSYLQKLLHETENSRLQFHSYCDHCDIS